jgi:hypothetical protein
VRAFVMSYAVHSSEYMLYREGNLTALRTFLELLQSSVGLTMYEQHLRNVRWKDLLRRLSNDRATC